MAAPPCSATASPSRPVSRKACGRPWRLSKTPLTTRGGTPNEGRRRHLSSASAALVKRPLVGVQPTSCAAHRSAVLRNSRQDAVRSPSVLPVRDGAGGNPPAPDASPEGGRMALFSVRPETRWPHQRASLMAPAVLERDSRTVKQVTIPVHGATHNGAIRRPFLYRVPRHTVTGVQPVPGLGALRAATRAMQRSRPGAARGPTCAAKPPRGKGCVTPALWGVTQHAASTITRPFTAFRR